LHTKGIAHTQSEDDPQTATTLVGDKEVLLLREQLVENGQTLKTVTVQLDKRTQDVAHLHSEIKEMERRLQVDHFTCINFLRKLTSCVVMQKTNVI